MATVGELDLHVAWAPNVPDAALACDHDGNAIVAVRAHFDDPDG